jgi:HSP20 family molecular chaperone IbpA
VLTDAIVKNPVHVGNDGTGGWLTESMAGDPIALAPLSIDLANRQAYGRTMTTRDEVAAATAEAAATMQTQTVPVNVYEAPEALVVVAPLPAVMAEDVTLRLRPGTLHIQAVLRSAGPRDYLVHEWNYGGYEREVTVPSGFGSDLEARLGHGQLVVRVLRGDCSEGVTRHPKVI